MRKINIKRWKYNDALEGLLFFAQSVEEMLFDYTIDSYKCPALNTHTLCWEILHIVKLHDDIKFSTIAPIVAELNHNLKEDIVVKKILKEKLSILEAKLVAAKDVPSVFDVVQVISNNLDDRYLNMLKEEIATTVVDGRKKRDLYVLARAFVTELLNLGYSKAYIYFYHKKFFYGQDIESTEIIKEYLNGLNTRIKDWEVGFFGSRELLFLKDTSSAIGVNIAENMPKKYENNRFETTFSNSKDESSVFISCNVKALDPYQAAKLAETKIDELTSIVNFYSHNKDRLLKRRSIVYCGDEKVYILTSPANPMHLRPNEEVGEEAKYIGLLLFVLGVTNNKFNKIRTAMDLHAISTQTISAGNQLLNLWSAIEGLFTVPKDSKSRIGYFLKCLKPILRQAYCNKIIKNIFNDVAKCTDFLSKNPEYSEFSKFVEMLCLKDKEPELKTLLDEIGTNPLLRFRLFAIHNNIVSANAIADMVNRHCQRVEWQIQRIYRARNFLVHSGDRLPYLEILVENLHNYFDTVLNYVATVKANGINVSRINDVVEEATMELILHERILSKHSGEYCSKDNYQQLIFGLC